MNAYEFMRFFCFFYKTITTISFKCCYIVFVLLTYAVIKLRFTGCASTVESKNETQYECKNGKDANLSKNR